MADPQIEPDTRWLLYDLSRCPEHPWVIAAAGRVENETFTGQSLSFTVAGMANTQCSLRARLPEQPIEVSVRDAPAAFEWDEDSRTVLLQFPNLPEGVKVRMRW